tara:strand:+ start:29 stop:511 length:483 start_codon:yes stop_codon:yes gene_type:complete
MPRMRKPKSNRIIRAIVFQLLCGSIFRLQLVQYFSGIFFSIVYSEIQIKFFVPWVDKKTSIKLILHNFLGCKELDLVQINLGKSKVNGENIVSLLNEKLGGSAVLEGKRILFKDEDKSVRMKDVKTYLKKYLHREGLRKQIRILVDKGEVILVELQQEEE